MNLYSLKIIAWVLSDTLELSHVVDCVERAKKIRSISQPLMIYTVEAASMYQMHFVKQQPGCNCYSKGHINGIMHVSNFSIRY